jgi:hypothetical protein
MFGCFSATALLGFIAVAGGDLVSAYPKKSNAAAGCLTGGDSGFAADLKNAQKVGHSSPVEKIALDIESGPRMTALISQIRYVWPVLTRAGECSLSMKSGEHTRVRELRFVGPFGCYS